MHSTPQHHDYTRRSPSPRFNSRLGFILATAGSAVGLGNIWRFPFVVGDNGGGAFLLPYLIAVGAIGIPAMVVEMAAGRGSGRGVVGTFAALSRRVKWLGVLALVAALTLLSYYLVVTGWALGYFCFALVGQHPGFSAFTAGANALWFFLASAGLTALIVSFGVNRGIEASSKILMPMLLILVVGLAIYGLSLPGRDAALQFYLAPRLSALTDVTVWIRALGQVFFSVGVGMGVLITYGAYAPRETNLVGASAVIAAADTGIALLAGLVVFPMAFTFGEAPGSGPQLAFDTLPRAFASFGPMVGYSVAVLFYLALTVAALTSAVSLIETVVVGLQDARDMPRRRSVPLILAFLVLLGLPSAFSYTGLKWQLFGQPVLDIMDTVVGTFGLPVGVLITAVVLSWHGAAIVARGLEARFWSAKVIVWTVRWVVPPAIALLLAAMALELLRHRILSQGG